jgi:hypothetical protein
MRYYKWALALALILVVIAATPVLADGPQPGTLPKSAYSGVTPGGGGKAAVAGGLKDTVDLNGPAPAGLNAPNAPGALVFYGWTNLMRFGSVGVNQNSWGCVNPNEVCSQGWSSTNQNIYFLQSGNYLCQNGSCTNYTYFGAYNWHWVWSGWRWSSTMWTWWSTTTYHYFNYGNGYYSKYTSNGQVF